MVQALLGPILKRYSTWACATGFHSGPRVAIGYIDIVGKANTPATAINDAGSVRLAGLFHIRVCTTCGVNFSEMADAIVECESEVQPEALCA